MTTFSTLIYDRRSNFKIAADQTTREIQISVTDQVGNSNEDLIILEVHKIGNEILVRTEVIDTMPGYTAAAVKRTRTVIVNVNVPKNLLHFFVTHFNKISDVNFLKVLELVKKKYG